MLLRTLSTVLFMTMAMVSAARAETIAIIGTGTVGSTLGPRWAALGNTIIYGSRTPDADKVKDLVKKTPKSSAATPEAAAQKAGVILLAVPGISTVGVVSSLGNLKGKVIIDATNVLVFKDGKVLPPADSTPLIEQIQAAAPDALAVKAFNTLAAAVMEKPSLVGGPVTVPIVGNDAGAKARVTALAKSLGLETVDLGTLDMARYIEELGRMYVAYSRSHAPQRLEYDFHLWKQ